MSDNARSLNAFRDVVVRLNDDVKRCLARLQATAAGNAERKAFWRRMYARAVFGLIDAATYQMTLHAYVTRNRPGVSFSPDELTRLEAMAELIADPLAPSPPDTSQMLDDMEFAFSTFARVHFSDYLLPTNDPAWVLVQGTVALKHSFQDPRQTQGMIVRDENIGVLAQGLQWFVERMVDLQKSCHQSMLDKNEPVM
jgi:hypothetical protein